MPITTSTIGEKAREKLFFSLVDHFAYTVLPTDKLKEIAGFIGPPSLEGGK